MNSQSDFIQAERILRIETSLGDDQLLATKLVWREAVSDLFEGRVTVRAKRSDLTPQDLLGKTVDVSVELGGGERRTWNALVTDLLAGPLQTRGMRQYELVLRPDLWLLSQTSDCRIWMDKTTVEVVEELMSEHGLPAPDLSGVIDPVPKQHYSAQYNETDLAYLVRRLEADGLFYFWSHEAGQHRLHLANHQAGYVGGEDVRFAHGSTDRNHVHRFETTFRYIPGAHAAGDWNFTTPGAVPGGQAPGLVTLPKNTAFERYEYAVQGGYGPGTQASDGIEDANVERVAKLRMMADEAEHSRVEGASTVRTLAAGGRFTPYDVANPDNVFDPHVILAIEHEVIDTSYESVENQPDYTNRFLALPADTPATPHRTTPRPRIEGPQVAIVAGPGGEEIHPDKYGRIKVWFPWDRRAKKDGSDTCWIRVMQNWAGTGWGGQVIPRIGMEVMVTYLDGDPDRPIITGVVPNERQKVPYELPANKTKSVLLRTDTHKADGFNEISCEDEAGVENMFFHAQKDMTVKVLNDQSSNVLANRVDNIAQNASTVVGGNATERTDRNKSVTVGGGASQMLGFMSPLISAGGQLFRQLGERTGADIVASVGKDMTGKVELDRELTLLTGNTGFMSSGDHRSGQGLAQASAAASLAGRVAGLMGGSGVLTSFIERVRSDTVGVARTEQIGIAKNTVVGSTQTTSVGTTKKLVVGEDYDYEAKGSIFGRTVKHTLHAKDKFVIAGPGGSITIDSSGVTIKTKHFRVKSPQVDFNSGSSSQSVALKSDKPFVQECKEE